SNWPRGGKVSRREKPGPGDSAGSAAISAVSRGLNGVLKTGTGTSQECETWVKRVQRLGASPHFQRVIHRFLRGTGLPLPGARATISSLGPQTRRILSDADSR